MEGNHTLFGQGANIDQSDIATQASHRSKGPPEKKFNITRAQTTTIDKWTPEVAQPKKEKVSGPSWVVDRPAHGPHRLQASTCHLPIGSQRRFNGFPAEFHAEERVTLLYKYEGRSSISWHGEISEELLPQDVVHLHL